MMPGDNQDMILYHARPSSFSQKVVIALKYLNLKYEERLINLFQGEHLEHWYLDINPKGEVPALKDGDLKLADSADILQYLNDTYDARRSDEKLIPNPVTPLGRQVAEFNQLLGTIKLFILTFGVAFYPQHTRDSFFSPEEAAGRKEFFKRNAEMVEKIMAGAQPPYKESYTYKLTKYATGDAMVSDESNLLAEIENTKEVLTQIENHLAGTKGSSTWLLSSSLTIADISLTVILYRIMKLGLNHHFFGDNAANAKLPLLAAYRARAFEQPYMKDALC